MDFQSYKFDIKTKFGKETIKGVFGINLITTDKPSIFVGFFSSQKDESHYYYKIYTTTEETHMKNNTIYLNVNDLKNTKIKSTMSEKLRIEAKIIYDTFVDTDKRANNHMRIKNNNDSLESLNKNYKPINDIKVVEKFIHKYTNSKVTINEQEGSFGVCDIKLFKPIYLEDLDYIGTGLDFKKDSEGVTVLIGFSNDKNKKTSQLKKLIANNFNGTSVYDDLNNQLDRYVYNKKEFELFTYVDNNKQYYVAIKYEIRNRKEYLGLMEMAITKLYLENRLK